MAFLDNFLDLLTAGLGSGSTSSTDLFRSVTGSGLTSAEIQQNQFNAEQAQDAWYRNELSADRALMRQQELRQTAIGDTVKSAQAAGINPYFALGSGAIGASSAPQASSPAASGSGGARNGAASLSALMDIAFAGQRFKQNAAMIENIKADTKDKLSNAGNLDAQTEGIKINNQYLAEYNELRNAGQRLTNDLTDKQAEQIDHNIGLIDVQKLFVGAQTDTEETKQLANIASAVKDQMSAKVAAEMLPYQQKVASSQAYMYTESGRQAHAQAEFALVQAAFQQGLIDEGVIKAQAVSLSAEAEYKDWLTAVKTGDPEGKVYKGKFAQFIGRCASGVGAIVNATEIGQIFHFGVSRSTSSSRSESHSTVESHSQSNNFNVSHHMNIPY